MNPNTRTILKVLAVLFLLGVLVIVAAGAAVYNAGAVRIAVHSKEPGGVDIDLPVPVTLLSAGLSFIPDEDRADIARELRPWMPAIQTALEELSRCDDGPLVEIDGPDEHVRVVKEGRKLVIDVDSPEATVHLSVPLGAIPGLIHKLGADKIEI
jgi:hypothetical protein